MKKRMSKALPILLIAGLHAGFLQPMAVQAAETPTNVALNKSAKVGFAAEISGMDAANTQSPASHAVDGQTDNPNRYAAWNDAYESVADEERPSVYFEVDLGQVYDLSSMKMWRYYQDKRTYKNTMIAVSEDEIFDSADTVIYSTVFDKKYTYGLNVDTENPDAEYSEASGGKEFTVDEGVSGRYVRVYMRGNSNPSNPNHAGNHLVELELYGTEHTMTEPDPAENVALKNAKVYQAFPTHYQDKASNKNPDGSLKHIGGQVTHPDIVKVDGGWNGYTYWAIYTPNVMITSQYENPYIAASNDGVHWEEPAGIQNPIEPEPISLRYHNCDADMIYNKEMNAMMAYWNWADDQGGGDGAEVRLRISYDGVHWGVPSTYDEETGIWMKPADASERTLKDPTTDADGLDHSFITSIASKNRYDMLSPTFTYDANRDIFVMWANNTKDVGYNNGQANYVETRWSEDGIHWSSPMKVNNFLGKTTAGAQLAPWHQDVNYVPELKEYWALSQCFTGGNPDGSMLYLTTSKDGINWKQVGTEPILSPGEAGAWDDFQIYRSSFLYDNGKVRVWYSALQNNTANKQVMDENGDLTITAASGDTRVWRIGYTENEYVKVMKVLTGDENYTKPELVTGTALKLTAGTMEMEEGESTQVSAAIIPENTSDQLITYTSSDEDIITVSPFGMVEAKGAGTATVTASTKDGIEDTVAFTVTERQVTTMDTWLSDIEWISQECGAAGDFPEGTQRDTNIDGKPLTLLVDGSEQTFEKGLGIHAPSSVTYNIAGRGYTYFEAFSGVDYSKKGDYEKGEARIGNFIVEIDGVKVAESGAMNPTMNAHHFMVEIPQNAKTLTLKTEIGEAYDWADWGNWASAKLIAELGDPENLALNKNVTVKRTEDDTDAYVNSDRPASMAVDGNKDDCITNYCDFGNDNHDESLYMQIDLGKLSLIEQVNLWRYWADQRTYKGTVIALSETSDFENPTIIYNSDKENFHGLGAGSDGTYAEAENGKIITLNERAEGRFLRIYMHGSNKGTTNHVVEVEAFGYPIEDDPVLATGIELRAARVSYEKGTTIKEGRRATLKASMLPLETTDEVVGWHSSNEEIAVVDENGIVTGISAGVTTITAVSTSGAEGTIDINVLAKGEKGNIRHTIDRNHPLYLENYYWSDDFANKNVVSGNVPQDERVDSPVMLWSTVPDSLKDNTVILLIAERSLNNTDEIKQWIKDNVELCNENGIPCAVQAVNGETNMANPIPIEFYEELAKNHEMLVGYNGAELYNRFNGSASEYMVDLIQICVENGVHMMWTDTNIFGKNGVLADWMQENQDLTDIMRNNKEYIAMMYKESYGQPNTDALYLGMWLTEYCDNWGIASDWWHWQLDGNGALFDAGSGGDAWKQCLTWPEAMYTQDILRAVSIGATCFKSEAQWYSNATKGMRTPAYQYTIAPFLKKLADGTYRIPTKEEVAERTKAIVVGRQNWNDFNYDTSYSQLYPKTAKYGIVPFVPTNCPEEALEGFDLVITENLGKEGLKNKLDEIYTEQKTGGNAWCETFGDTWYFMNSSEDKDVTQNAVIAPKTNNCESLEITAGPHTYGVMKETKSKMNLSLGNYRIDKSELWNSDEYAGWFSDMDCYEYVWELCERMENDTNHDKDLRTTTIRVVCDSEPRVVYAEDDEYTRPYETEESWDAESRTFTLTVKHNGIVNLDIVTSDDTDTSELYAAYNEFNELKLDEYRGLPKKMHLWQR